uniref:Trafficking protein particle complex subunit 3 n=2 Tax=Lygus hesperus TaxID=30085 RepID=A0A0A9VY32_LYGHE
MVDTATVSAATSLYNSLEKMNPEVFALLYGALVTQLLQDHHEPSKVNEELFEIGVSVGACLVEEYLARLSIHTCTSFHHVAQSTADAFSIFLGVQAAASAAAADDDWTSFHISFTHNPLNTFVQLPPSVKGLVYSNIYCGALVGALKAISIHAESNFIQDELYGDPVTTLLVVVRPSS